MAEVISIVLQSNGEVRLETATGKAIIVPSRLDFTPRQVNQAGPHFAEDLLVALGLDCVPADQRFVPERDCDGAVRFREEITQ